MLACSILGSLMPGFGCGGSREPIGAGVTAPSSSASGGTTSSSVATGGATALATSPWEGVAGTLIEVKPVWDYNGIVGTGQSLAVGNVPVLSTKQLYNNLMLSREHISTPWDPESDALALVPLIEVKNQVTYPAPYPLNLFGETPHSAMANQVTAMVRHNADTDYVTVHSIVGESGQGIEALTKSINEPSGDTGWAYVATIYEAKAIARLAKSAGKSYGISAIVMTHGETDAGNAGYRSQLVKLLSDYNTDLSAITGQTKKIPMLLSQQFAFPEGAGQRSDTTNLQWKIGVDLPEQFICTGPKYQYPGHGDGVHLATAGYQQLGEKTGQVYYERIVLGHDWQPLQPTSVSRDGRVITVSFHVPVPPLTWDESLPAPTTWANGKGFEVRSGSTNIPIASVAIDGDQVKITCDADLPASGLTVGYAMTANADKMAVASRARRWGQLRDSDPFVGHTTKVPQPNYCVAFEMSVP